MMSVSWRMFNYFPNPDTIFICVIVRLTIAKALEKIYLQTDKR